MNETTAATPATTATPVTETDMDAMIPLEESVTINGEKIVVERIKVKQLNLILQSVAPIISVLRSSIRNIKSKEEIRDALTTIILSNPTELLAVIGICINRPVEWIESLEIDELLELAIKVIEVNLDFFTLRVLPAVLRALGRVKEAEQRSLDIAGQTPSST
jgi:hypothetical protein